MEVVNVPIDALIWTDKDGSIHPVRFRLVEDEGYRIIKIDKLISAEKIKLFGHINIVFRCQSVIDYIEKVFELRYIVDECRWVLWKI